MEDSSVSSIEPIEAVASSSNIDMEDSSVKTEPIKAVASSTEPIQPVASLSKKISCIVPVPLRNRGENICFFNAPVQVFNSLVKYHTYVLEPIPGSDVISKMKELFIKMKTFPQVHTYPIASSMNIPDHHGRNQVDALNVVRLLVENTKIEENGLPDFSFFKITETTTVKCSSCNHEDAPHSKHIPLITLGLEKVGRQSISQLMDNVRDPVQRAGYNCENCDLKGHCQISTVITVPGDYMILHLKIYDENDFGQRRKLFPDLTVDSELSMHETFDLQGVISHHGFSWTHGHYTSDIKVIDKWYHADDSRITTQETFQPDLVSGQVPYIVVYKKRSTEVADAGSYETSYSKPHKRTRESSNDDGSDEDLNSVRRFSEDGFCDTVEPDETSPTETDQHKKFNFGKKKVRFSSKKKKIRSTLEGQNKNRETAKVGMEKIRSTPEGKEKNRKNFENLCSTPEGREKNRKNFENFCSTPEGREKNRKNFENLCSTPKGGEKNRSNSERQRSTRKDQEEERIRNLPFPPKITNEDEKRCIENFCEATSPEAMKTRECGICGIAVKAGEFTEIEMTDIPHKELLSKDNQENQDCLPEYLFDIDIDNLPSQLLLSPGGVDENQNVVCCKTCFSSLKKEKLPKFSVANNFQIGKTPPELTGLTLAEKLLISKCRPKMYVLKLRTSCGGEAQRGLKGNTITFPQDVVKIAAKLPANPDILADHLNVVFIGKTKPTPKLLKKVVGVCRQVVYNALNFLIQNNPEWADVTLDDNVDLPDDDVPDVMMQTLTHEEETEEDAKEHSTYTPQTDIDNIPSDSVIMDSVGMVDFEGSMVNSTDQITSAILQLQGNGSNEDANPTNDIQGTMIVPHGATPVNEYSNPLLWLHAYPWLYPYGRGAPECERKVKVGLRAYIKHVLKLKDRKFSLDISLKFHAFNIIQKRDVSYHTSLHVRRPGFSSTAARIDSLTQESMTEVLKHVENKTPITDPVLKSIYDSMFSAGKHVNGSPFQKSTYRRQIFGLMIQMGTPVLWITISPAVVHSPIFLQIAGYDVNLSEIPSLVDRAKLVANDPVAAAIYYNTVIDAFTQFLLGYKQPDGGCFGHPSAYYGMTEEQGTGTLHNHMLVWLHNFESTSKLEPKLLDETFKNEFCDYLERIIKQGYLESDHIEKELDVSEVSCRYPIERDHPDFNDDVNNLVTVANTHKCRATCHKYGHIDDCRMGYPRDIVPQTEIDGLKINLKRTDKMINNFNPVMATCI